MAGSQFKGITITPAKLSFAIAAITLIAGIWPVGQYFIAQDTRITVIEHDRAIRIQMSNDTNAKVSQALEKVVDKVDLLSSQVSQLTGAMRAKGYDVATSP